MVAGKQARKRVHLLTLLECIAHAGTTATATRNIVTSTSTGTGISGVAEAALAASVALTCERKKEAPQQKKTTIRNKLQDRTTSDIQFLINKIQS